jgi:signal transduction histidine kinase/ActR/RegA family two-component response regulator
MTSPDSNGVNIGELLQSHREATVALVRDAFLRNSIYNQGRMRSPRNAIPVAQSIFDLFVGFLSGQVDKGCIEQEATRLADQGLVLASLVELVLALYESPWLSSLPESDLYSDTARRMGEFEAVFISSMALGREAAIVRSHEQSELALQRSLNKQLTLREQLHGVQEQRNRQLRQILQLNARIAALSNEDELLDTAVNGLCQALDLIEVSIYLGVRMGQEWLLRTSSVRAGAGQTTPPPEVVTLLDNAVVHDGEIVQSYQMGDETAVHLVTTFILDNDRLAAVLANSRQSQDATELLLMVRTFSQNLAALWRSQALLRGMRQRTRELEILHGRHVDTLWLADDSALKAAYTQSGLEIQRLIETELPLPEAESSSMQLPVTVGDNLIGRLTAHGAEELSPESREHVDALLHEMGSALSNAQLIQATRSYSNQLQLAAQVSKAAGTVLDRDVLIEEVVELIRDSFDLYYVGLFLVNGQGEAALQAGTGEAGRLLVERGHKLPVGGHSMVGQAIAREKAVVEQDVAQAVVFHRNPLLPDTRSELAMPLRTRGRTIGALTAQSNQLGAFPQQISTILQSLADQLATAIENASLFSQVQENLTEMSRLYRSGRQISEAKDAQTVHNILVAFAAESDLFDVAHVVTVDNQAPDYIMITALWSRHGTQINPERDRILRDRFPTGELLANNQVIIINDGQSDEVRDRAARLLFKRNKLRGCALLPIYSEDQWLATLALHRHEANPPTEQELRPFRTLCDQASVILANQRLLAETNTLYRVSRVLNQAISQEDVLFLTVDEIVRHTAVDQCRIILYDQVTGTGRIAAEFQESDLGSSIILPMACDYVYEFLREKQEPLLLLADQADEETAEVVDLLLKSFDLRASLLIPAVSQQELIGFLTLDSHRSQRQFTPGNIKFARTVADQFTTTTESIKLFDEALRRAQELITLNQIGAHISSTLDLQEVANVVYEQAGLLLDNTIFLMALYDAVSSHYQPLLYVVEGRVMEMESRTIMPSEPLHQFLHSGQPLQAMSPKGAAHFDGRGSQVVTGDPVPQSSLWIPLLREGLPIGLVSVQSFSRHAYKENDLQLLRSIATQAGLALSNARLFKETQENVAELRLLFSVTQAAASSVDFKERVESTIEALYNSLGGAAVSIFIVNEADNHLDLLTARGATTPRGHLSLAEGLASQVVTLGQPLMVNDLRELPDFVAQEHEVLSQLVVPLTLGRRTIGIINADSHQVEAFTERDLRLLQTLSVSLAATIESGRLFQEIQSANEQLRELDRLKTQFLANMSHELRTPLNSIIGFSRVILKGIDGPITPEQEEDLASIHNSGQHLLRLINDILDLAKIEAGKMALAFETVDLEDTARSVLATAKGLVADKPVKLHWHIEANLPHIEADPIRLRQILLNFLSNAIKFTVQGQVRLEVRRQDSGHIVIMISDTGVGIDRRDYNKLFAAFEQADSSPTRAIGGTGLGLPITRRLIELHQGRLEFESEVGHGTTFQVTLPIRQSDLETAAMDTPHREAGAIVETTGTAGAASVAAAEAAEERRSVSPQPMPEREIGPTDSSGEPVATAGQSSRSILIVDDEPGVVSLYERYLRSQPYQLISVNSGLEALSEVANHRRQIAVVLLDINMPDIDGWDVLKVIRDNPETTAIPVIVCSIDGDPKKASALGAQLVLPKPIVEDDLLTALLHVQNHA